MSRDYQILVYSVDNASVCFALVEKAQSPLQALQKAIKTVQDKITQRIKAKSFTLYENFDLQLDIRDYSFLKKSLTKTPLQLSALKKDSQLKDSMIFPFEQKHVLVIIARSKCFEKIRKTLLDL